MLPPPATMATSVRASGLCGYGYGLGAHAAAVDAICGRCARLEASAGQAESWREGRRGRHIVRMRPEGAESEALGLLRTFWSGPPAAPWAMAGEAPAPRLNDRSRPLPRRGNG